MSDIAHLFPNQKQFDTLYTNEVERPWSEHKSELNRPWRAPEHLRKNWLRLLESSQDVAQTVGAVALCRTIGLTLEESEAVDCFWKRPFPTTICPDIIVCLLVTGGTPPPSLWHSYFLDNYESMRGNVPASWWLLLAWFLRHPANGRLARDILVQQEHLADCPWRKFIVWQAQLNPLAKSREADANSWMQAATLFHPSEHTPRYPLGSDLNILGYALRWFLPEKRPLMIQPFHTGLRSLLALRKEVSAIPLAAESMMDPSREALLKVEAAPAQIAELWRYYTPILRWPWDEPVLPDSENPAYAMALGILGYPPFRLLLQDWENDPDLDVFWREHPCFGLC